MQRRIAAAEHRRVRQTRSQFNGGIRPATVRRRLLADQANEQRRASERIVSLGRPSASGLGSSRPGLTPR